MKLLEMRSIRKAFRVGVTVLDDLSLSVEEGEVLALIGSSGSGKSTVLRCAAQLETVDRGEIDICGRALVRTERKTDRRGVAREVAVYAPPAERKQMLECVGMVFQNFNLFPHMTVLRNITDAPVRVLGKSRAEAEADARQLLETMGLSDRADAYPCELSGGQQQRVALARAVVIEPSVLLFDEPLSNLDAKLRTSMRTEIIKLHKKLATTFIYVTHDQTEAMTMGDRIVVMKDGIIQQVDTPQNLYDMPCNMFVAGFIGSPQMNFLDGTVTKNGDQYAIDLGGDTIPLPKEKTADGKLDSYVGKKVKMGIRPEDIDDEPEFMAKHPDCHLEAQVDVSEMMGAEIYLYLEYKGNKMTARVAPTSKARNGDTVRVAFDPHKVHLFDVETEQTILN